MQADIRGAIVRSVEMMASFVIIVIMALFAFVIVFPHFSVVPDENQQMLSQQTSTLQNVVLLITAFFFGQSSGNLKKDDTIAHMATKVTPPNPSQVGVTMGAGESATIQSTTEVTTHENEKAHPQG
jgi:hypothetical protein